MKKGIGAVQAAAVLLAGIFIGSKLHPSLWLSLAFFSMGLGGGLFFYLRGKDFVLDQRPNRISRIFFCLAIFAVGMGRTAFSFADRPPGAVENFVGQRVEGLTGYIVSPPVSSSRRWRGR